MPAIPASAIVAVTPGVISAGGTALDLNGLLLTTSNRIPIGTVSLFSSQADVADYFGLGSTEAALATNYFLGFDNSNKKPGGMLLAQYNTAAVGAWLRGEDIGSLTLTQLQAISGATTITVNGVLATGTINLSAVTSFSDAAESISVSIGITGPVGASCTGSIGPVAGGSGLLTVGTLSSGTISIGQEVHGSGVTAGTLIVSFGTGVGGVGTYAVNKSQTVATEALTTNTPFCTYDSVRGGFFLQSNTTGAASTIGYATGSVATSLGLTQASGALLSQGAIAATPATFMPLIVAQTQNWATFTTAFDPDSGSGSAVKQLFAAWVNGSVDRYAYVAWDSDITPTESAAATTSLGYILEQSDSSGTIVVYSPAQGAAIASFIMGMVASVDFTETNGRTTAAFRSQTGLSPDVTSETVASNLKANGYNYYGIWATANDQFTFLYDGEISGPFLWIDSYIDQIWLNNQFQLAFMELLTNTKSIPYNQAGYTLIKAAAMDPINQGLNFGAFRAGVTLSSAQIAEVNAAAGVRIDDVLSRQGWYLQVKDALPQVRAARGSPPCTFWYMDGQSVQKISLASIEVQ